MTPAPARYTHLDGATIELTDRLLALAVRGLPRMYRADTDEFAFTRIFATAPDGIRSRLSGASLRYAAIVALGVAGLPAAEQPALLGGHKLGDFAGLLIDRQAGSANLGDTALITWLAAATGHARLDEALSRLAAADRGAADRGAGPVPVVEAAWVVSALAAARGRAGVEDHLTAARARLLGSVPAGGPLFPHATGPGLVKPYRAHVSCFADQVYPIQALARLHHSGDDPEALDVARRTAEQICRLQGPDGQWWWFYDVRTGDVVEGYPVYSVHQHAMAPMALLDLTEAGGGDYAAPIRRGLSWLLAPAELAAGGEPMLHDAAGLTVRKVYRGDPRKLVRGLSTATTRLRPGLTAPVGRVFRPGALDRECRPYEFGWLLFAWTTGLGGGAR